MISRTDTEAKTAHVNLMTDTVIASLPAEGLRAVIRAVITSEPTIVGEFERQAKKYLIKTSSARTEPIFATQIEVSEGEATTVVVTNSFYRMQGRIRSMLGCGLIFECLPLLTQIIQHSAKLSISSDDVGEEGLLDTLASVDGDIVQAVTAVQKQVLTKTGSRPFTHTEGQVLHELLESLLTCREKWKISLETFVYARSLILVSGILHREIPHVEDPTVGSDGTSNANVVVENGGDNCPPSAIETFQLGETTLPRIFSGLWQLSSPSWGVAPWHKIVKQFAAYVDAGFTAFDMADHYGDAEVIFGRFRASYPHSETIFASTKLCVFHPITVTPELIQGNVAERISRLQSDKVDLLQFHWQDYTDSHYLDALTILQQDERIRYLGLCNFDTEHLEIVLNKGINVVTNQVQFSLIDSRPIFRMGDVCMRHNVKLLTYGSLCGGFLADKWLGQSEPELFLNSVTPSQRKYYEMICTWGSWTLFQELLQVLSTIATKHKVALSNVATRWVLDFPYVGAVIVGARMGVSEHAMENLASYGWTLDAVDRAAIDEVQKKSRAADIFRDMGDCGAEYR